MMRRLVRRPPCPSLGDLMRTVPALTRASFGRDREVVQWAAPRDRGLPLYEETGKGDSLVSPW